MEIFLVGGAIFLLVLFIYKVSKPNPEPVMVDYYARKQEKIRETETKASLPDRIEAARAEIQVLVDKHNVKVEERNAEVQKEFEAELAAYHKALESPVDFDEHFTFEQQFLTVGEELIPALYIQKIWIRGEVREPIFLSSDNRCGSWYNSFNNYFLYQFPQAIGVIAKHCLIDMEGIFSPRIIDDAEHMLRSFSLAPVQAISRAQVNICIEIASGKIIEMECPTPQAERVHDRMREEWKRTINSMPLMEVRDALESS